MLIHVHAAAVTISDCIVRSGKVRPLLWLPMRRFVGFGRPRNPVLGLGLAGKMRLRPALCSPMDVHVRWLREKIEQDPSAPTRLVTVRSIGYRFEG